MKSTIMPKADVPEAFSYPVLMKHAIDHRIVLFSSDRKATVVCVNGSNATLGFHCEEMHPAIDSNTWVKFDGAVILEN